MKVEPLVDLGEVLAGVRSIAVLAGEGLSVEANRPESYFAGDSLWENNTPTELARPEAFARDPGRVWRWYLWRRGIIAEAGPGPGQRALARLAPRFERMVVITESQDGQQQRAGGPDGPSVIELYGNLWHSRCARCGKRHEDRRVKIDRLPPTCAQCDGLMRPDVVWYGEPMNPKVIERAERVTAACELLLIVGAETRSSNVVSLRAVARQAGVPVAEIDADQLIAFAAT